jgi:hypothetical protein
MIFSAAAAACGGGADKSRLPASSTDMYVGSGGFDKPGVAQLSTPDELLLLLLLLSLRLLASSRAA